jgi:hypothetical protein
LQPFCFALLNKYSLNSSRFSFNLMFVFVVMLLIIYWQGFTNLLWKVLMFTLLSGYPVIKTFSCCTFKEIWSETLSLMNLNWFFLFQWPFVFTMNLIFRLFDFWTVYLSIKYPFMIVCHLTGSTNISNPSKLVFSFTSDAIKASRLVTFSLIPFVFLSFPDLLKQYLLYVERTIAIYDRNLV